jgi:hypothetical protein
MLICIAALLLLGADDDRYPTDISPPPGTHYPCALTALPRALPGIPEAERGYINRTYTRVLRATQAKLVVLAALYAGKNLDAAMKTYEDATSKLAMSLRDDRAPAGLEDFQQNLGAALDLQRRFFRKGAALRKSGRSMDEVYDIPEGREASNRLIAAWGRMEQRYPSWNEATKDSIYHHLCALDLF